MIFEEYVYSYSFEEHNGNGNTVGHIGPPPFDLLLVCHRWKNIVRWNRKLFTRIFLVDNRFDVAWIIPTWIRFSGSLPLEVIISPERWDGTVDGKTALLESFVNQMHRIRTLTVTFTPFFDTLFPAENTTVAPGLQELHIFAPQIINDNWVSRSSGVVAENLRSLVFNTKVAFHNANFALGLSLISFDGRGSVEGAQATIKLLSMCPNLRKCFLGFRESNSDSDADLIHLNPAQIPLEHLVLFDIKIHKSIIGRLPTARFQNLVDLLDTPSLMQLKLDASDIPELQSIHHFPHWTLTLAANSPSSGIFDAHMGKPIERWLARSRPPLRQLSLVSFSGMAAETFRHILEAVPTVSELELRGWTLTQAQLSVLDGRLNPSICPLLKTISFHSSTIPMEFENFLSVVGTRWVTDTDECLLAKLVISNVKDGYNLPVLFTRFTYLESLVKSLPNLIIQL